MTGRSSRAQRTKGGADALEWRDILRFRADTFARINWGHKGLLTALKGVTLEEARWSPGGGVHSVWQHVNHVAHWKRAVLYRLRGRSRRTPQAWPPAGAGVAGFRRAVDVLERLHRALQRTAAVLSPEAAEAAGGPRYSAVQLLLGEAAHDAYHTGQIFLTRKLYRRSRRSRPRVSR